MWRYVQTLERKVWINQEMISQIEQVSDDVVVVYFNDGRRLELWENYDELLECWGVVKPLNP